MPREGDICLWLFEWSLTNLSPASKGTWQGNILRWKSKCVVRVDSNPTNLALLATVAFGLPSIYPLGVGCYRDGEFNIDPCLVEGDVDHRCVCLDIPC